MLEHYMFPYGNKRELQWRVEGLEADLEATKVSRNRMETALRNLERQYWKLQEELHEVHIHKLQPIVDQCENMSDMSVFIETFHEIKQDCISVNIRLPAYRLREESAMDYTERAINQCANMLARKLTHKIAFKLKQVYLKLKGD